jgi:adenylosuccinate synthase
MNSANVTVLVGAQWGDEGKGKWIDVLAQDADLVVRYQGGNNAGHTLYIHGEKVVLHQVPSGVFHAEQKSALAAGVVVNPTQLVLELDKIAKVKSQVPLTPDRLWLSGRAHVITPWHIHLDQTRETSAKAPIGTTKRGIGPTYADKAARSGLRLGHYVDDAARGRWVARMLETNADFKKHFESEAATWKEFAAAAARLKPFVCDAEAKIRSYAHAGKRLLVEGAQGTLLDLDHGTYPYVTSSGTGAGGACQSIGLSPKLIGKLVGIAKAYVTRVGEGPFPTELKDAVGKGIAERGQEFGATTGRPRRVGWMDAVALRYVVGVNGLDGIALNKIDILSGVDELKIAVAYKHPELGLLKDLPWDTEVIAQCEPVYESYPGWTETITGGGDYNALPRNCRAFIEAIEKHGATKVLMVGTGPKREDCVFR